MTEYHILSLGAGVQSTCVYLMGYEGKLPLTHAVFADTMDEPEEVYRHLQWLDNLHGIPIYIISVGSLSEAILAGANSGGQRNGAAIPVFMRTDDGKIGRYRRQCTKEYKIDPFWRCVRRDILGLLPKKHIPKDVHIHVYFGISTDEARRTRGIIKRFEKRSNITVHFPLIMSGMTRNDCHKWMEGKVPHIVPRSACVYCPYHNDHEWQRIKFNDPSGWAKAVKVDEALRDKTIRRTHYKHPLFLHRSLVPLSEVDFTKPERTLPLFNEECEGMCGN